MENELNLQKKSAEESDHLNNELYNLERQRDNKKKLFGLAYNFAISKYNNSLLHKGLDDVSACIFNSRRWLQTLNIFGDGSRYDLAVETEDQARELLESGNEDTKDIGKSLYYIASKI